ACGGPGSSRRADGCAAPTSSPPRSGEVDAAATRRERRTARGGAAASNPLLVLVGTDALRLRRARGGGALGKKARSGTGRRGGRCGRFRACHEERSSWLREVN